MKKILQLFFMSVLAMSTVSLYAQERTITGRVTATEDGQALPGVNVVLKGTTTGAVTDSDGNYRMVVPSSGGILVFTFIGLKTQEVPINNSTTLDIQMESDATQLGEIVVTALGVKRDVKSLPYAAQTVSTERLSITRPNNINDALAGKVAGVQVRGQSGAALGRNSSIRIRGAGSLTDKAPLYVLDGTPVASEDINPDDIESINVLKGPAATALYGQRGDAGVVLMTSKKSARDAAGIGVNVSQNLFFDKVYVLPRYQNSYAGGAYADLAEFTWENGMPEEWKSLDGKFYHDYTDDGSWGPRMVGQEYIPWYAWIPGTKYTGKTSKLVAQPDNIRDFYETGVNRTTNVSFNAGKENFNVRVAFTNQDIKGIMPNTELKKNTLATNMSFDLSKLITVGTNINYVNQQRIGEFDDGYSNQSSGSFNQWFHRNIDMNIMKELQNVKSPEGRLVSWNHFNPEYYVDHGDQFYRGYYWYNHFSYFNLIDYKNNKDRLFGDVNITFKFSDKFKVSGFYRKNQVTTNWEDKRPSILPYSFQTELRPTSQPQWDYYGTGNTFRKEDNLEAMATYSDKVLGDKLTIELMGGGNIRMEKYTENTGNTLDGLVVPDLFTLSNSRRQPFQSSNLRSRKEVRSIYGRGSFGYNDLLFLDVTARNDWSSALPAKNNSYFYPSVGLTFIFSEFLDSVLPAVSFGKLRGSWAQVGSDLDPYLTALTYGVDANQWNGNILTGTPNQSVFANIKPALSASTEAGIDLKFFENKLGISATYYMESKRDEILSVPVSGVSGFTSMLINAGQIDRSGIELQLDATPFQRGGWRWDVTLNAAKNKSEIVELAEGIDAIPQRDANGTIIQDAFATGAVYNAVGENWGQIRGFGIKRNADNVPILNDEGLFVPIQNQYLGSVLPDFTGGLVNMISYKNFLLNFNIDFQKGGKFFSLSDYYGTFSGLTQRTASLNDKGIPVRDAVSDGGGVHVKGVDETSGEPVEYYVEGKTYYQQFANNGIAEEHVYDLSFVKLREVSFGYQIPVTKLGGLSKVFTAASFSLTGRNLWLISSNVRDFDPSEISNTFGENGQFPGTRSYGFNLKLSF
jgi:TonB-linked SusC/RagA family outer membrane protein